MSGPIEPPSQRSPPVGSSVEGEAVQLVTVIIPSHGRPDLLRQCLASLQDQTYPRYEVLVVDDASRQEAAYAEIARQYGARLLRNPVNRGPGQARNRGVRESAGDVLIFLDDDCTVDDPEWIARHAAIHSAHPGLLVGGGIDPHAPTVVSKAFAWINQPEHRVAGNLQSMNLSLTRTTFDEIGPFREDLRELEDVEFTLRAKRKGKRLHSVPEIRVTHSIRATLGAVLRRTFEYGYWLVPVCRSRGFPVWWLLPDSLPAALLLFLPLAGVHALIRTLLSLPRFPAVAVCLPLAFLFCLSHAAGVVWYHWRRWRGKRTSDK